MDFTAQSLTKAREAGYTDDEIWGYLSQQNKGFSGARDAGYSLDETMDYVSKNPSIFAPQGTSFTKEIQQIGPAFMESLGRPLESMGETAEVFGFNDIAEGLKGAITEPENYESAAARFTEPKEGDASFVGFAWQYAPRAIVEQTGQLVGSIATRVAGGIAGAPAGPAGVAAGAFVGPAVFEAAQIIGPVAKERAANNGRETPTKEDIAGAILTATGSGALNAIGARYLPGGEKATGKFFKRLATSFLGETPTEAGQSLVEQVGGTAFTEKGLEVSPKQAIAEGIIGGGSGAAITAISAPLYREPKEKKIVTEEEAEEQDIEGQSNIEAINLTAPAGDIQTKKDVSRIAELEKVKAENELLSRALEPNEPEAKRLDLENAAIDKEITRLQGGVIESAGLTPINQAERDAVAASKEETPTAIATRIEQTKVAMAGVEPTSRRYTELQDQLTADEGKLIEQQQAELAKKIAEEPAPPVSKQDTLDTDTIAGIRSGVASADPDVRELWAENLRRKLEKKGSLAWSDIPQDLSDSMDTVAFGALKNAIAVNPEAAIDLIEGKVAPPVTPAPTAQVTEQVEQPTEQVAAPTEAVAPVSEPITEPTPAPTGIAVGNRIKLGRSPQTYTIEEVIPQSEAQKELGEQYYSVKNEKTGEVQTVEKADIKPVKRLRKGEAGGVLIPSREDFEDLGRRIYEKGMQFKTWADRMVAEFGDAVRSFLGDIWQAVSGIPAKINELAGYLPGKGEGGGVLVPMGEEPPKKGVARYQKKSQVAGIKNIGSVIDTPKGIKKTTEKIIKDRFLNVDDVSEANTAKAWNLIGKLQKSNPESEQTVGAINELVRETIQDTEADDVVKQSIGGAIMRNELYKYAIKLTAQGDNKMLNYLLNNRLAIASGAIDEGDAGRMLNALANLKNWIVRASDSEQSAFIEIAASRFFDTKKPTEDQVNKIKSMFEAVKTTKIDQEKELSAELEEVGKATGIDVAQKVIEAVESSVASRDPWLVAFEILRKELGEPLAGFSFKPFSMSEAIKAAIKPKLANYMKSMTEQGAKGLEATFWKTMSDQEKKSGPLAEVDAAINRNLAAIVKETLIKLGMKGKVDNTKMTLIEQVANILTNQKLTQEKMALADKRVLEEINRREGEAIERAGENQDAIDAAEAEAQALRDAWNEAMGQQMNLPVSEATLGRLINNEMKEAGTKLSEIDELSKLEPSIADLRKRTIVNSIINKLYGIVLIPTDRAPLTKEELAALDKQVSELEAELANDKKRKAAQSVIDARQKELDAAIERRDAEKKRTEIPKRDYDLLSKALNDKFNQMIEARQLKTKMAKAARDSKAELNKPDKQAESQIKRLAKLQSDTQDWAKAKKDEVKAIVQNDLRNTPDMGRKEPWKAMLVGQLKQAGVSDTQAGILADLVWNQHEKNALTREMDALNKAVEKGPIKGIVDAILNTPLSEQQKPEWRKEVIKKYLIDAGVASSKADNIAKLFDISLQKRFAEAQVKAAEEAMKGISGKLTPESRRAFQAFIKAIRAQVVNPGTDAAKEFGKQMGWKGFTPEQIAKINELDAITQDDKTTDAEKSVAIEKIQQIIDDVSLPPRVRDSIGQFFIGNVLLRITTFASQLEPIVYKIADTTMESIYSLSNPQLAWLRWGEFFNSFERAARETIFSFSNDVSRSGPMIEYLDQDQRQLRRLYIDGEKKWKAGNYSGAMKNLLFGHPFVTYRTLNALDDGMNSLLKDGYLIRYMESAMKMAKIPKGKRIGTIRQVLSARQMDIENMIERGIPKNDAIIYANERMFSTVTEDLEAAGLGKTESQEVVDSAINDSLSVLGKIRVKKDPITGEETEIENIGTPITKYTMKFYKYMARLGSTEKDPLTRAVMKVLGRWIIGFPTTFSRVFSRAMGYTPLTLYRHFFKGRYPLTYGTAMQSRQRLFEQMSFTVVMMPFIMMAARTFTGDDDEKKKKGINIYFTGMGPSKKFDPEVYAQWDGKYDRGTMVVEIDGEVVYTLDSKTSGPFAPYIYTMGAIDDWKWRVKNKVAKLDGEDADEVSNAIELGNHLYDLAGLFATTASKRSQLTGLFNMGLVNIRNSDDPITQMSRDLSFKSMPLVPIIGSGIADNLSDLFSQPIDNKTTKGAILSNTPIFGPMLGKPAFNAYGQQLGELNISQKMKKSFGIPLTAVKLKNENDEKINFITLSKGEGPSPLTIDRLEKEMESPLTEQEFEIGMKAYGKSNYDLVLESYDEYMEYSPKEFAKALKDISSYSRDVAIEAIEKHREKNP